jgi:hypothetical protein
MYGLDAAGQNQLNTNIICTVLSIVAVLVRVYCKTRNKQGIKSDDWWIIVALAWYLASVSIVSWGMCLSVVIIELSKAFSREHHRSRRC